MDDAHDSTRPSTHVALPPIVWILSVIAICVALGYGIVAPALPIFAKDFGVGHTAAALVISMFAAARMASAFGVGRLVDVVGGRVVLGIGLVIVAVSSAVAGLSQNYLQLLFLRGAGGVGSAMFSVAAASVMANRIPSNVRGRAMSVWSGSFLLGGVLGPVVGAPLIAISLRAPFFFYAATLGVGAVVAFIALPHTRRIRKSGYDAPLTNTQHRGGEQGSTPASEGLREAWALPQFRLALLAALAQKWTVSSRNAIVPMFITEALLLANAWSGYALAVAAAVNAVLLLPLGKWTDTHGRIAVVTFGGAASALAMAALALPPALWIMLLAMGISGIGAAAQAVGPSAILGDVAKGRRGSVIASFQVTGDTGSMLGPFAAGLLTDAFGFSAAFTVTAVMCLLSAVVAAPSIKGETPPESDDIPADGSTGKDE